jgi:hypothetical protein
MAFRFVTPLRDAIGTLAIFCACAAVVRNVNVGECHTADVSDDSRDIVVPPSSLLAPLLAEAGRGKTSAISPPSGSGSATIGEMPICTLAT